MNAGGSRIFAWLWSMLTTGRRRAPFLARLSELSNICACMVIDVSPPRSPEELVQILPTL